MNGRSIPLTTVDTCKSLITTAMQQNTQNMLVSQDPDSFRAQLRANPSDFYPNTGDSLTRPVVCWGQKLVRKESSQLAFTLSQWYVRRLEPWKFHSWATTSQNLEQTSVSFSPHSREKGPFPTPCLLQQSQTPLAFWHIGNLRRFHASPKGCLKSC